MISVQDWAEIRRLHKVEKLSKRATASPARSMCSSQAAAICGRERRMR